MRKKVITRSLTIGVPAALLSIFFFVFQIPEIWSQLLAIIASAFLGAGVTAWLTNTLLTNQQKSEETKEKNIKVFENKIQVYSEFISRMWKTLEDDTITDEEIRGIRLDIFNKLIFYFDRIDLLEKKVDMIKSSDKANEEIDSSKRTNETIQCFSEITELLRIDVERSGNMAGSIKQLWNRFAIQPRDQDSETISVDKMGKESKAIPDVSLIGSVHQEDNTSENSQRLDNTWHFNALGDQQFKRIEDDLTKSKDIELSLIEYGEYWRTNLMKQVRKDDCIMLFRRGGYGYVGAFKAIGRRIFDFEKGEEEILYFNEPEKSSIVSIKDNKEAFEADAKNYDIYESKEDGATLCSNLIVTCIGYVPDGVGNPGGVYRRTISRYDSHYAWLLKERFQNKGQWINER